MKKLTTLKARTILRIIQHLMLGIVVFVIVYTVMGSNVVISGVDDDYSYELHESDKHRSYDDTFLFNNILGNNISNVVRLTAIRSQIETNGVYDGNKLIDVTAYCNRYTILPGDYCTAVYTVSDLLKWAQNDIEYESREYTADEADSFLSDSTTYTHLLNNVVSGGMNSYLSSQLENNMVTNSVSENSVSDKSGTHTVLFSRYKTVDGKNPEDLVSNWNEYQDLCSNISEAANDLETNYEEYLDYINYYDFQNTNLRYFITRSIGGKTDTFTNVEDLQGETTGIDIMDYFKSYGKYIYYCPYELSYDTNTRITEDTLRSILKNYNYAYPDQIRVYLAVDTSYACKDDFSQGKDVFSKYIPNFVQVRGAGIVAGAIYLIILIYLSIMEGHFSVGKEYIEDSENKEIRLERIDNRIYSEILVLLIFMFIFCYAGCVSSTFYDNQGISQNDYFPWIMGATGVVFDLFTVDLYYSLVRKIKAGHFWKDTMIYHIISWFKRSLVKSFDNSNVVIRSWLSYALFLTINFALICCGGVLGGFVVLIFDIFVGIFIYRTNVDRQNIINGIKKIQNGDVNFKLNTQELHGDNIILASAVNSIGDGIEKAVNISMKDEKMKADLITNVSHDIKTPLTSIINYVDLLKRENIADPKIKGYITVLDEKSQRLKQLTEDLVEASKISSGNISLDFQKINFVELINQTIGEFYEKFESKNLTIIFKPEEAEMYIMADSRHLWRVIENLLNNVYKYALANTRVYLDMKNVTDEAGVNRIAFSIKNISENQLNINADELTERFIRGDVSRSSEGSGLGLSIAKNLTSALNGQLDIDLDGDLFKVIVTLERAGDK